MIGHDIAATLPELRSHAESMMTDACVITGPNGSPTWDDATGTYTIPAGSTVYAGPCRLRMPGRVTRADSGDAAFAVDEGTLSLPVDGSEDVGAGMVALVALGNDPIASVSVSIQATHVQTNSTARRLPVKLVSRDA